MRGAEALAAALCSAAMLTHLVLSSNQQLGDAGLRALCGSVRVGNADLAVSPTAQWRCLRTLELQGCGITTLGIQTLSASPNSAQLRVLYLDGNPLGTAGGEALVALLKVIYVFWVLLATREICILGPYTSWRLLCISTGITGLGRLFDVQCYADA